MKKEKLYKILSPLPRLTTERLALRPMNTSDAVDMFEYASRDDLTEYLLWSSHPSLSYTRDYLAYIESRYARCDFYDWAITLPQNNKMIGTVGFTKIDCPHNSAEIGYVLNPQYHSNGYATEAAQKILSFGFDVLRLHRIEARFMEENIASLCVMKKLGMSLEGYIRDGMLVKGRYRTIGICSILENEYRKNP